MGQIFYLCGKSACGKDTLFKELLKKNKYGLKTIVPYTTRPIRTGETNGVEYFFTDEEGFRKLQTAGKIAEDRAYHTVWGLWRYFTVDDGQIDLTRQDYLLIGTLEGYEKMKRYFGADRLKPILVELDDGIRLQRALDRERSQEKPGYAEMCRRFLADEQDFCAEKIRQAGIDRTFVNEDLETCLREIEDYIKTCKADRTEPETIA